MTVYDYLKLGWYLLPIKKGTKVPLTAKGFHDASNDMDVIADWIEKYPDCQWAVSTGPSDLVVIDYDTYKGIQTKDLDDLLKFDLPATCAVRSASGGLHRYYAASSTECASRSPMKGIDTRAATGYVLLPPSQLESGGEYTWLPSFSPKDRPLAEIPIGYIDFLNKKGSPTAKSASEAAENNGGELFLREGQGDRWELMQSMAGGLRAMGWGYASILNALRGFVSYQCEPGESVKDSKLVALAKWVTTKPASNQKQRAEPLIPQKPKKKEKPPGLGPKMVDIVYDGKVQSIMFQDVHTYLSKGAVLLKKAKKDG